MCIPVHLFSYLLTHTTLEQAFCHPTTDALPLVYGFVFVVSFSLNSNMLIMVKNTYIRPVMVQLLGSITKLQEYSY